MVCLACRGFTAGRLCRDCSSCLRPAPDRLLDGGLLVRSAFVHEGAARLLVHNLKYRGIEPAGWLLAEAMTHLIPAGATLVAVPRIVWREIRHGIDPAVVLAARVAVLTGAASADLLVPQWLGARQAGRSREQRKAPFFLAGRPPNGPVVLVDDVVTTGGTVLSAWRALGAGPATVISATSVTPPRVRPLNAVPGND